MTDPISIGTGLVGVIGLAVQIAQVMVQFGLDWKDAPHDVKAFMAELQTLKTTLLETNTNLILNSDFAEAFQNRPSILLSQLGPNVPSTTDTKLMLEICEKELKDVLKELEKRAKGRRVGWERMKGAFLSKNTRGSVENLHRQCQALNKMVTVDAAVLGATTYKEVKNARKEQQDARAEQQEVQEKLQASHQAGADKELLTWLTPVDYATQQSDFISRREEGTGKWLLDSDRFRTWVDHNNQTLFCPGIPGAGKTINTAIVIDELYTKFQNNASVGIAYIYCNFRRKHEQRPIDLLTNLLKQLIQGLPSVPQSMQRLYEQHQHRRTCPSIDEILQALQSIIHDYSKAFIIIDALDEFQVSDGGRKQLLTKLFSLQTKTAANLFVTSRFIPEIEKEFDGSPSLEIRANNDDVQRYLNVRMTRLRPFVLRNLTLQEEIKNEITKAVDGMFLLAQLYLDSLSDKMTPKAIRLELRTLQKEPETSNDDKKSKALDHAYKQAMERIEGQEAGFEELAKKVLSWITCAKKPLTTLELRHALAVEIGETQLDEENLPEITDMISVCAGLVTIDEESKIIRLVHYTTQEFFERTQKTWFPKTEIHIANVCTTYLSFDVFHSGFCASNKEFEARLQLNPFYDYAARHWGHHLRKAPDAQLQIPGFINSEAQASASSQVMMLSEHRYDNYSQMVPRQMRGLHLAVWFGLAQMVDMLLEDGNSPDCTDSDCRTPLSYAAGNGHEAVVRLLVARADVETDSKNSRGRTPLSWAAGNGHEAVVKLLVARADVEVDLKNSRGRTPLSWAAGSGHEAVVRLLVARADVEADSKDRWGQTPLSWAAGSGHEAVVRLLVARADVEADSKDSWDRTPLSWAAGSGHEAVVRVLAARADVETDSKDSRGQTPLLCAAWNRHEAVVKLLVARDDVEVDLKNLRGRTPLSWAAWSGHEAVAKSLQERNN